MKMVGRWVGSVFVAVLLKAWVERAQLCQPQLLLLLSVLQRMNHRAIKLLRITHWSVTVELIQFSDSRSPLSLQCQVAQYMKS